MRNRLRRVLERLRGAAKLDRLRTGVPRRFRPKAQ
jgi:hypothetical protein